VRLGAVGRGTAASTGLKARGYKKMPRALRDAIAADAIFGVFLLVRALL